jgi:hypothetical protein
MASLFARVMAPDRVDGSIPPSMALLRFAPKTSPPVALA